MAGKVRISVWVIHLLACSFLSNPQDTWSRKGVQVGIEGRERLDFLFLLPRYQQPELPNLLGNKVFREQTDRAREGCKQRHAGAGDKISEGREMGGRSGEEARAKEQRSLQASPGPELA